MDQNLPELELRKTEVLSALQTAWHELVGAERINLSPHDSAREIKNELFKTLQPEIDKTLAALGITANKDLTTQIAQESNLQEKAKLELNYIAEILIQLKQLDGMKCGSFPKVIRETKSANCTGQTMMAQRLMQQAGITFYYANPAFHVMNIAKTSDGRCFWVDSGTITDDPADLEENLIEIQNPKFVEIAGTNVLEINQPPIDYKIIPIYDPNEIVTGIAENMETLHPESGIKRDAFLDSLYKANKETIDMLSAHNISGFLSPKKEAYILSPEYQAERERIRGIHYPDGI